MLSMKMPWYSSVYQAESSTSTSPPPRRPRFQPSAGVYTPFTSAYRQPSFYATRRTFQAATSPPESFSSPFRHHRRAMDAATERLLARADALTERLHKLLAKSADLHFHGRMPASPSQPPQQRTSGIYSHRRMSHNGPPTAASPAAAAATKTDTTNPDVHSQTSTTAPPRVHVINIKLSNSCWTAHRNNPRPRQSPKRTPVVHIIPIRIETDSSSDGEADTADDIDVRLPDEDECDLPVPQEVACDPQEDTSDEERGADGDEEEEEEEARPEEPVVMVAQPSSPTLPLSSHQSRRLALTIRCA